MSLSDKIMDVISGEEIIFISDVKQAVKKSMKRIAKDSDVEEKHNRFCKIIKEEFGSKLT